jgi:YegS/Rv2252/BmrU family lipid kinase
MSIIAIVNPISGAGMDATVAGRRVAMIRDELKGRGLEAEIHLTTHAGHARALATAAAAADADLVIVWGGDGTVNEVGSGLAGTETPLGLIPAGSGNGLAGALGVPRAPRAALATLLGERMLSVDVGMLGDRPFFNVAGIGLDAHIARLFNQRTRGRRGRLPYVMLSVRAGCRYVSQEYRVTLDGESPETSHRALLIAFANGREYGMGMQIAPGALLDDGLLEASIVEDRPVLARFLDARYLTMGIIERAPKIVRRSVRAATVEADGEIEFHVDGEPGVAHRRLDISVRPGALRVKI